MICISCVAFKKKTKFCTCDKLVDIPLRKVVENHIHSIMQEQEAEYEKTAIEREKEVERAAKLDTKWQKKRQNEFSLQKHLENSIGISAMENLQ